MIYELWKKLLLSFEEVDPLAKLEPPNGFRLVLLQDTDVDSPFEILPGAYSRFSHCPPHPSPPVAAFVTEHMRMVELGLRVGAPLVSSRASTALSSEAPPSDAGLTHWRSAFHEARAILLR